jgi:hypothetical protein
VFDYLSSTLYVTSSFIAIRHCLYCLSFHCPTRRVTSLMFVLWRIECRAVQVWWPCGLRRRSAATSLLVSRFESRSGIGCSSFVLVVCCVGSDLCGRPKTRSEESYRVWVSNCVYSENLEHEAAWVWSELLSNTQMLSSIIWIKISFSQNTWIYSILCVPSLCLYQ